MIGVEMKEGNGMDHKRLAIAFATPRPIISRKQPASGAKAVVHEEGIE